MVRCIDWQVLNQYQPFVLTRVCDPSESAESLMLWLALACSEPSPLRAAPAKLRLVAGGSLDRDRSGSGLTTRV